MRDAGARLPLFLISSACAATFLVTGSGMVRAPFLLDMSRDLEASLGATANLFSMTAFAWGIASLFAGAASDSLGRLPVLALAHGLLVGGLAGIALSGSYWTVAAWTLVAGTGGGAHMGVIFAAVSDRVGEGQRGRALGGIMTGQSLAFVAGVPIASWLGALLGWRGVMAAVGAIDLVAMAALWLALRGDGARPVAPGSPGLPWRRGARPGRELRLLLAAGVGERVCFGVVAVYFATMLQLRHGLDLAGLTLPLALMAAGNLAGNAVGSSLADRVADRPLAFAASCAGTALLALLLFAWDPGLAPGVALGFLYSYVNALGRPSLMAVLGSAPRETRGALLGFNITCASVGWISAAAIGAMLIESHGIAALGPPTALVALASTVLALAARRLARASRPS
ncbi:MAG: MFS transporter [Alphaproteobacteria bacterium]